MQAATQTVQEVGRDARTLVSKTIKYGFPYSPALFHLVRVPLLYYEPSEKPRVVDSVH